MTYMRDKRMFVSSSQSEPTLDWERSPVLGADRRSYRARQWRRIMLALGLFWLLSIAGAIALVTS